MTTKDLLWKEIYNSIKREIILNKYKINKKLDSENDYAKQFNVNRHTIRRAFKEPVSYTHLTLPTNREV